ncbi:molybdopterin containing oxidoreductase [Bosea caraganae]|uniref:Molybdopterin containing oxidoreductase n=1 Tax=Bosea caraganae TaxID=2763117 RepID=A0A370L0T1_9HYPH|nr:sulfite oxidase [Bosea caraganae]RDJ20991.1 molybdopterin containing oxidoreductase [Bosea caraganae]RDJ28490.1 molybdopterin containing oxidoreductase [Bosea caraganae]
MPRRLIELPLLRRLKPGLYVHDEEALNAEPEVGLLDQPITPVDAFFIRNNGALPEIDHSRDWTLTLDGEVERPRAWTVEALRERFETVTIAAVLECAGNGRSLFSPPTDGLQWRLGAVGCARWTGVRLKDLLEHAGARPGAVYTAHHSPDRLIRDETRPALSRGLPIAKALSEETLVAFAMNGEPLPPLHGGPLRIVAPGFPGSAWQKWLSGITIRPVEHDGEKMCGTDYRMPVRPVLPGEPIDKSLFEVITDMPVKALVTAPVEGFSVEVGGAVEIRGFAWSGTVPVAGVSLSSDGGASWREAALEPGEGPFAWRRFRARFVAEQAGPVTIIAQARDEAGNVQPLHEAQWNPRGYCNNQAQRVRGTAR